MFLVCMVIPSLHGLSVGALKQKCTQAGSTLPVAKITNLADGYRARGIWLQMIFLQ